MLAALVIVFREVLEAGLVIGIVLAATRGVPRQKSLIVAGLVAGLAGAVVVAVFAGAIADAAAGFGQELFNAAILLIAVVMLGWHNVWMGRHGRELAAEAGRAGAAIVAGEKPAWGLSVVIAIAVLREGAEVVLFLYGIAAGGETDAGSMLTGGMAGVAAGGLLGAALHLGLLRLPMKLLFGITSALVALLAAGMAAQAAGFLIAAGAVPTLGDEVWDTSHILSDHSLFGIVMRTLVGYIDRPAGLQVAAWVLTLGCIVLLTGANTQRHGKVPA